MKTYIALLRGINIGGHKKIKMADLREHLQSLSFEAIQTYIQSGNIVFEAQDQQPQVLAQQIHDLIEAKYGFDVPTLVKMADDMQWALNHNPFKGDATKEEQTYFTFLEAVPEEENLANLMSYDIPKEEIHPKNDVVFFYSEKGYGKAKLNNNFIESKLKVAATTRNHKTVSKLLEMAR